jgi:hypothetical protein
MRKKSRSLEKIVARHQTSTAAAVIVLCATDFSTRL